MLGILLGDFVGKPYEHVDMKGYNLPLLSSLSGFTDDTVMALSALDHIKSGIGPRESLIKWCQPRRDFGFSETMKMLLDGEDVTYLLSDGNGAPVRCMPYAFIADSTLSKRLDGKSTETALEEIVKDNASLTHSEEAVAWSVTLAKVIRSKLNGLNKEGVVQLVKEMNDFDLESLSVRDLHKELEFTTRASVTVPIAIHIAINAKSIVDCMRTCLYVGGDVDSIMAMACCLFLAVPKSEVPVGVDNEDFLSVIEAMILKAKVNDADIYDALTYLMSSVPYLERFGCSPADS